MIPKDEISGIGVLLAWFIGGLCGVCTLLLLIFYCCLMPRNKKNDDKCCKEDLSTKEIKWSMYNPPGNLQVNMEQRSVRPMSYAGVASVHISQDHYQQQAIPRNPAACAGATAAAAEHYASSSMLDDIANTGSVDSLKTRSLPAFLRNKQRPLSTEDDLYQLYAKVNFSKKRKNRMRNDDAAIIALSKSRSQCLNQDAVIVYDERTAL